MWCMPLQEAETLLKHVWSVTKLLQPNKSHETIILGLACAISGLGKIYEAKDVLRAAGLAKKSMQEALPGSYHRWLKPRVAKYMDGREEEDCGMYSSEG
ncbi:hypothetical protein CEUSTIGMA_g8118.t1 [Chlamydomonas eustigma]|uniref:Uncharacterized protein n=1 Tax=Chlamydomonas eustigma TaxID=1157962 RepID=A0A250XC78_9CHLO|nr:hypothetical protein CEUSTIGMA_g8118.t1 [Chlamydomonas eustigma]|eukprot:GAX80683.1 hypothetical protein CEUSTIGMA_g8118.t1 [Chlamydomonas eustigma]